MGPSNGQLAVTPLYMLLPPLPEYWKHLIPDTKTPFCWKHLERLLFLTLNQTDRR